MSRILVTGANGFIGRHLCRWLVDAGYDVRGAQRRLHPECNPPAKDVVAVGDIGPSANWKDAVRGVDCVIHLAARVHETNENSADPFAEYVKVNVGGTRSLLQACSNSDVRHFIYLSSIKVNGEATVGAPFSVADAPAPEDPYGRSKFEAELLVQRMCEEQGIDWTIVRSPLVYGPGVKANFARLVQFVKSGIPIPLGACTNRRSMIYVGNLCDLIGQTLVAQNSRNKIFLVSDGHDFTMPELIQGVGRIIGKRPVLLPIPIAWLSVVAGIAGRRKDVKRLTQSLEIDISETCRLLNWRPPYDVDTALSETLNNWQS